MNTQKKLTTAVATAALFLNFLTPVAAQTISGNNTHSSNYVNTDYNYNFNLNQDNNANVNNSVTVSLGSGGNKVKDVVGGEVTIETGKVEAGVEIANQLNMNVASFNTCGSCGLSGDFKIADNNSKTDNDIKYDYKSNVDLNQQNDAKVANDVDVTGTSGGNKVDNAMNGDITVETGKVSVYPVAIKNVLNANWAVVASSKKGNDGVSAWILGNNTDSDNYINIDVDNDLELDQDNDADVVNDVAVGVESGKNEVDDVAGAEVSITTGKVEVGIILDTMANFNMAAIEDCCFLGDQVTKIADNNVDTDNDIEVDLDLDVDLDQDNDFNCGSGRSLLDRFFKGNKGGSGECNDVDITGGTGGNEVDNASSGGHDPEIKTGGALAAVAVKTSANLNVKGSNVDFDVDFDEVVDLLEDLFDLFN